MNKLPAQYDLLPIEDQLKMFEACKVINSKNAAFGLYEPFLRPLKKLVKAGVFIFFNFDFVTYKVGQRASLQFQLACSSQIDEQTVYYPIKFSFYAYDNHHIPTITLIPNKEYVVNPDPFGYEIKDDNTVHFDFWQVPESIRRENQSLKVDENSRYLDYLFINLIDLFTKCSPYRRFIHDDFQLHPSTLTIERKKLGSGAYGTVFNGVYNDIPVAIKVINYCKGNQMECRERDISLRVNHPSVIKTYGYIDLDKPLPFYGVNSNSSGKQWLLVMEKADCDLVYYLDTVEMAYKQRKHLIVEIATVLEYLFDQSISIHDIKPENILIKDGCIKISDFGLASTHFSEMDITKTTVGVGNVMHLSYENRQIRCWKKDEQVRVPIESLPAKYLLDVQRKEDVYGLGILIMDILLGYNWTYHYVSSLVKRDESYEFAMRIPKELCVDPVISSIVRSCLERVDRRPFISYIVEQLKEWEQADTKVEQEVVFNDLIGPVRLDTLL